MNTNTLLAINYFWGFPLIFWAFPLILNVNYIFLWTAAYCFSHFLSGLVYLGHMSWYEKMHTAQLLSESHQKELLIYLNQKSRNSRRWQWLCHSNGIIEILELIEQNISKISGFKEEMVKNLFLEESKRKYSEAFKAFCDNIYIHSPAAYKLIRIICPLPNHKSLTKMFKPIE